MTISTQDFQSANLKLIKIGDNYAIGSSKGIFNISPGIAQQLQSQGIDLIPVRADVTGTQQLQDLGVNTSTSGTVQDINQLYDRFVLPGIQAQQEQAQVDAARQYNIAGGFYTGAPQVGGPLTEPNAPKGTTLASMSSSAPGTPSYRDAKGNVFDAQGNILTLTPGQPNSIQLGTDGKPLVNLVTLPLKDNKAGGDSGTGSGSTAGGQTDSTGTGIAYDPSWAQYGIDQNTWNSMNATQQGVVAVSLNAAKSLYSANASDVTLQKALDAASKDPNITAKYADAAAIDLNAFNQGLQQLQVATSTDAQARQIQFENERKALAEQHAAAGTAYSGFRGKAQQDLATSESGIVTSSRAQIQQQLDQARAAFESKYGTAATPLATTQFQDPYASAGISLSGLSKPTAPSSTTLSGGVTGGITGSQPVAKQQEINQLASNYVTLGQTVPTTPA